MILYYVNNNISVPKLTPITEFIIMSVILSCVGLLTIGLVIYLSFQAKDEVLSLAIKIAAASIFLLIFLSSPLLIKLVILGSFLFAVPFIGEHLSLFFYHQLKK